MFSHGRERQTSFSSSKATALLDHGPTFRTLKDLSIQSHWGVRASTLRFGRDIVQSTAADMLCRGLRPQKAQLHPSWGFPSPTGVGQASLCYAS